MTPCLCWALVHQIYVLLYVTTVGGALSVWQCSFAHVLLPCYHCVHSPSSSNTCHHTNLSSFITPQPPLLLSPQYVSLVVETAAICTALQLVLLPAWKAEKKGGIHQNCADSALSVVGFFIIHQCCSSAWTDSWMLQGVRGKDNVHGRKG